MSLSLGARMRKGLRNFCQGDSSTSTGHRHNPPLLHPQQRLFLVDDNHKLLPHDYYEGSDDDDGRSFYNSNGETRHRPPSPVGAPTPTLEEMIKQLELEEEMAAVASARKGVPINRINSTRRASCVNTTSDRVLRSARNALNQYPPRFSLDGKDSMYRSSFLNNDDRRGRFSSACCCDVAGRSRRLASLVNEGNNNNNNYRYDQKNVVWCRPGVVPKLMGLDAIPIPRDSFFAVYNKKAPALLRKRRYGGDEDIERVIRPPGIRRSGNR